jgi:hypothetical protein
MEPSAKVRFVVANEKGSSEVETLWAVNLGADNYKLDNSPFYAYSVSWKDIVYAPLDEPNGMPAFKSVVSKSGNRTIRIISEAAAEPGNASQQLLDNLVSRGCSYEGTNRSYIAVNIPPPVDLAGIVEFLNQSDVQWEHADPTYEEYHAIGS